jgi:methanogenic corrinoid protein MtbC1
VTDSGPPRLPPVDPAAADAALGSTLSPELLAGLLADGDEELATWALGHSIAEIGRAETFETLVAGAMALVGTRWRSGQWSIAEEHLASQTLMRALERVRPTVGPEGRIGPQAVLAAVSGEHHMIGLVCLDQVLEEAGWSVANLGADVPAADLALFVARHEARLVALTASEMAGLESVVEAIAAVRAARAGAEPLAVMIGGRLAATPGLADTLGVDWAGTSLTEAAAVAEGLAATIEGA